MAKLILTITLFSFMLIGSPITARANSSIEIIDTNTDDGITISTNQNVLHVTGANGQTLQVYNLVGVRVMSIKVEGADKHYELNLPKGYYIVKIGRIARKILIR